MSRSTFQGKAGLIFALVAFVLGLTAATALGWENENNKGNGHGKKETPPTVTTPTTPTSPQPAEKAPPPAPTPTPQAVPPTPAAPAPPEQVVVKRAPKPKRAKHRQEKAARNVPVETPSAQPTLAPAVERKQLARTGLDPVLMALLGLFCLAGGGLLFRRAIAR
jgi:outer membrane biosynthesis protein TonB